MDSAWLVLSGGGGGVYLELDVLLLVGQHLALCSADLLSNEVHPSHHFCHRVLHLHTTCCSAAGQHGCVGGGVGGFQVGCMIQGHPGSYCLTGATALHTYGVLA